MRALAIPIAALAVLCAAVPVAHADNCAPLHQEAARVVAMRDADPAGGVARGDSALADLGKTGADCPLAEAMLLSAIGTNLHILGRNAEAVARFQQSLALLQQSTATPTQLATVHRGAGVALADMEAYDRAIEHYLAALAASREVDDVLEAAKTAGNIGNLYNTIGQLQRSRDYHEQALRDFRAVDFKPGIAGTLVNLGSLAAKFANAAAEQDDPAGAREQNQELLDLNQQALALFTELGNERGIAYASSNIGLALERLGDPAQALAHHQRSLELRERIGDVHGEANSHLTLAATLVALSRFAEAQSHLDRASARAPAGHMGLAAAIAAERVALAEARGDLRDALDWQRELTRMHSAMAAEDHRTRVAALQGRFDSDQQARQIELLQSSAEVRELQLQRQRMILWVAITVAVLLMLLFALVFSRMRLVRIAARELEAAARTDQVTGLANRRHISEQMRMEKQRSLRSQKPFAVVMADIDNFKSLNDRFGHALGDAVLREVGARLAGGLRGQDMLARWGGEEFLMLLPETNLAGGGVVAEKLRRAMSEAPYGVSGESVPLTLTLGVSECAPDADVDACIDAADQAMYVGKREGRNRVALAGSGTTDAAV